MESTSLELYETAYRLHYVENNIPESIKYYEALIKEFPDSNEAGYAIVQIQKIKAGDVAKTLKKNKLHPVSVIALVFSFISLLIVGFTCFYMLYTMQVERNRFSLAACALGKMYTGEDDEALKLLSKLKILDKTDIAPFDLSADIYRKQGLSTKAKVEYEIFTALNPASPFGKNSSVEPVKQVKPAVKPLTPDTTIAPDSVSATSSLPGTHPQASVKAVQTVRKTQSLKHTIGGQKSKSKLLVNPDSISYF